METERGVTGEKERDGKGKISNREEGEVKRWKEMGRER